MPGAAGRLTRPLAALLAALHGLLDLGAEGREDQEDKDRHRDLMPGIQRPGPAFVVLA